MSPHIDQPRARPSANGPLTTVAPSRPGAGLLRRGLGMASTAAVVAGLAGAAYYGHHTGWTFLPGGHGEDPAVEAAGTEGLAQVRFGPPAAAFGHLPPALRRPAVVGFDSAEAVSAAGIDVSPVWRGAFTEAISVNGEIGFDPARVARVSARVPGQAWRVTKAMGDTVRAGEVVALIDAAEVGKAKAEYQQALVQARLRRQVSENLKTAGQAAQGQRVREAEAARKDSEVRLLGAEQALTNLGLPVRAADFAALSIDQVAARLRLLGVPVVSGEGTPDTANLLPVRAPFDGVVLAADAVAGEVVEAGKVLLVVVDPSRVWLTLHVSPEDARRVAVGQPVLFRADGLPDEAAGRVTWVGTAADEATRTVPVRSELANDSGQLRASTFGRGRVVLREVRDAVVVPHEAVRQLNTASVVFVRDPGFFKPGGPKAFHARPVRTGGRDAQNTEVVAGLEPGEVVATKGSGLLLNELTRAAGGPPAE